MGKMTSKQSAQIFLPWYLPVPWCLWGWEGDAKNNKGKSCLNLPLRMCIVTGWTHDQVFPNKATISSDILFLPRPLESTSFSLGILLHHNLECLALMNISREAAYLWHAHVGNPPEALGFLETQEMCVLLSLANTPSLMVMLPLSQLPPQGQEHQVT